MQIPLREDSYWLLWQRWNPHPKLHKRLRAWMGGAFRPSTYIHNDRHTLKGRRPVILGTFSACVPEEECFEDLLEKPSLFRTQTSQLWCGWIRFGSDHAPTRKGCPYFPDAIVIFGLMTLDLDRSQLQTREASKPFFEAHKDGYHLKSQ